MTESLPVRVYFAEPSMLSSEVQGEIIVLHTGSGQYFGLNQVASHVWKLLERGATFQELVESTLRGFSVTLEQCERDMGDLIRELLALELIRGRVQ